MKRMGLAGVFTILLFLFFIITTKIVFLILLPIGFLLGYKIPFMKLKSDKSHDNMRKSFLFPQFLRYFISLIGTQGNVYQTIKATTFYLDTGFKEQVEDLVYKIEMNNNNYDDYMNFADYVGTNESNMVMSMIYDFSEYGVMEEELEELEKTIEKLRENKANQMVVFKADDQEKYMNTPILMVIFFTMSFTVISLVYNLMEIAKYTSF